LIKHKKPADFRNILPCCLLPSLRLPSNLGISKTS
jgi:hypothetical protein